MNVRLGEGDEILTQQVRDSMAGRFNIYSQLAISAIRIADINNTNSWYHQYEMLISLFRITDINNAALH